MCCAVTQGRTDSLRAGLRQWQRVHLEHAQVLNICVYFDEDIIIPSCLCSGAVEHELKGHDKGVWWVQFAHTKPLLATSSNDCTIRLWSTADWTSVRVLAGHTVRSLEP